MSQSRDLDRYYDFPRFPELFGWIADGAQIQYNPAFREFTVAHGQGDSAYTFGWCPITGRRLPRSLRSEWFDALEAAGLIPSDTILPADFEPPAPYCSDAWWRDTSLANDIAGS